MKKLLLAISVLGFTKLVFANNQGYNGSSNQGFNDKSKNKSNSNQYSHRHHHKHHQHNNDKNHPLVY